MKTRTALALIVGVLFTLGIPLTAQEFRGRINGVVTDNTGAVLPGATVTAAGPALIRPQSTIAGADGTYRFPALPAGVYTLTFELAGFQKITRENIRVVINTTLTLDAQLTVATLQESITVSGQSPIVDTSTTTIGTNFTKELLTEIPNARDIWAAIAQAPGFQVTGYDVGGSHTGTQTGYVTYGVSQQNTTRIEGVNTSEGASANAGYFDFGSFEEFQLGGAGNMADQDVPGASLNITVKSGGNRFTGSWYSDFENDKTISNNVGDAFRTPFEKDENGFFTRAPGGLTRGNPITKQYDMNFNVGGPIVKNRAWFFYSYRLNDQYKTIIGMPDLARSKLSNPFTVKGTFQLSRNNQLIAYVNKREKLQDKRDLGPTTPLSAAYYQSSRNYPWKFEWTSVLSSKLFLDVLAGNWYNFFPLRPQTEVGGFPVEEFVPGRLDLNTNNLFSGGANNTYQDQKRYKPQFHAYMSFFQNALAREPRLQGGLRGPARPPEARQRSAVQHLLSRSRSGDVRSRALQRACGADQRRQRPKRLRAGRLEVQQPSDAEPRPPVGPLHRRLAGTAVCPGRPAAARRDHRSTHHRFLHAKNHRGAGGVDVDHGRPSRRVCVRPAR